VIDLKWMVRFGLVRPDLEWIAQSESLYLSELKS
jgi:hypothetical protein